METKLDVMNCVKAGVAVAGLGATGLYVYYLPTQAATVLNLYRIGAAGGTLLSVWAYMQTYNMPIYSQREANYYEEERSVALVSMISCLLVIGGTSFGISLLDPKQVFPKQIFPKRVVPEHVVPEQIFSEQEKIPPSEWGDAIAKITIAAGILIGGSVWFWHNCCNRPQDD